MFPFGRYAIHIRFDVPGSVSGEPHLPHLSYGIGFPTNFCKFSLPIHNGSSAYRVCLVAESALCGLDIFPCTGSLMRSAKDPIIAARINPRIANIQDSNLNLPGASLLRRFPHGLCLYVVHPNIGKEKKYPEQYFLACCQSVEWGLVCLWSG